MAISSTVFDIAGNTLQVAAATAASASSTALPDGTEAVRLFTKQPVFVAIGTSPITAASTNGFYMGQGEVFNVKAKAGQTVAVRADATAGTLFITPLAQG
jgi:hypothetical protein